MSFLTSDAWLVSEDVRDTILPYLPEKRPTFNQLIEKEWLSPLEISREIIEATQRYEFQSIQEHPEQFKGFESRSHQNRKLLTSYLNAFRLVEEFFSNKQNIIAVLGPYQSLPIDETLAVIDRSIKCLERNFEMASTGGRQAHVARSNFIVALMGIWKRATWRRASVTLNSKNSGGPFVRFACAVASSVLHASDKKRFLQALVEERKKMGKTIE